jgi:hypothetical protein
MFELSLWRFEYWLVALILVLLFEDQNEINDNRVFVSSINERRNKRLFIGDPLLYKQITNNSTINIGN